MRQDVATKRTVNPFRKPVKRLGIVKKEQNRYSKQSTYRSPGRCIDPIVAGRKRSNQVGGRKDARPQWTKCRDRETHGSISSYLPERELLLMYKQWGIARVERGISCCLVVGRCVAWKRSGRSGCRYGHLDRCHYAEQSPGMGPCIIVTSHRNRSSQWADSQLMVS